MAIVTKKREDDTYGRLLGMAGQPSATPTRRVGAETPTGSAAAGPKGGQTPEEFTSTTEASPGSVFKRQLEGAKRGGIGGITALAERPLQREFGQEIARLGQEGIAYKQAGAKAREEEPQFQYKAGDKDLTQDIVGKLASGDEGTTETAQQILNRGFIPTKAFTTRDIKEFTPQAALRGGSVESLLRQEAKGPYSTGMAGLDALLFKQQGGARELAQKGQTLRGAGQLAANVLQGKGEGVLDKGIQAALEKVGVTGNLTKEQEELNKKLVEQQKADLEAAVKAGILTREEAYTKAEKGKKSKLQEAQEKLKSQYEGTREAAKKQIREQLQAKIKQAQAKIKESEQSAFNEAYNRKYQEVASNYVPTEYERSIGYIDPFSVMSRIFSAVEQDPTYARAKAESERKNAELAVGGDDLLRRATEGSSIPYAESEIPTLGFQNVVSAKDAEQYNRLQALLGGQQIEPSTIAAPKVGVNQQMIDQAFQNLLSRLG